MKKKVIIEGMSCGHCVNHVKEALIEIGGKAVEVDLASKTAILEGEISDESIKEVIDEVGYEVISIENI